MTLTEQQVFEQTRNRIQHNLSEIGALARTTHPPGTFFQKFLELSCDCLNATGGAVWAFEANGVQRLAQQAFATSAYDTDPRQKKWVESVLAATANSKQPHIVAAEDLSTNPREVPEGSIGNVVTHPFFYHPVVIGDRATVVLQIWLPQPGDPRSYNDISSFLGQLCAHAETYLRGWQGAQLAARNDQAQSMLRLQGEFVGELDPKVLESSAANYLVDLLRADLACVFHRKSKKWALAAASNQEAVDSKAVHSQALSRVAVFLDEAPEGKVLETSAAEGELHTALESSSIVRLAWCHISSSKNSSRDTLLFAAKNEDGQFPSNGQELVSWTGNQLARALDAATHFHHIPLRPVASSAGHLLRAWNQNRRRKIFAWIISPIFLAGALLAVPYPWKIAAECTTFPARRATVVAEASGKILRVDVKEGDAVVAGQVLAQLDDTDYATQLAVSRQQLLRWQVEAGKAQAMGSEAERKIAELGAAREEQTIRRIEFLRTRTRLVSPIDGVVLTRNLQNREGEAIEVGKPFCEIGGSGEYQLLLDIHQKDLGDVLGALEQGRELPVDFILHPHPTIPLSTTLSGAAHISQIPEQRKAGSVFIATATFPKNSPLDDLLKPGFTGKAKISMGRRPLGWIISRPFMNFARMNWGV